MKDARVLKNGEVIPENRMIGPKHILPQLHFKTHFKAVQEYALGDAIQHKSMRD